MNLPTLVTLVLSALLGILIVAVSIQRKKNNSLSSQLKSSRNNHNYLITLLKDIQDISGYGNDMENVIDVITKSLENTYPHSTIASAFIKGEKLIFKAQAKETVSHPFINHIKDTMIHFLSDSSPSAPAPEVAAQPQVDTLSMAPVALNNLEQSMGTKKPTPVMPTVEIEEAISGVPFDDIGKSEIKSSLDIKLMVNFKPQAIINIASTSPGLYSEDDKITLSTIADLVSDFLTRLDLLLKLEKSRSLAMIDSFSEGIFMLDRKFNIVSMNNSAKNFLNITTEHPTIKNILSALPNTYNFEEKIQSCTTQNKRCEEKDVAIGSKSFKMIITPVLEIDMPGNNIIGTSILLQDITLEKSLSQLKEDFTNVMVHELRSPLTAIKASSDFLKSQADLTPDEKRRLIEMVSESSRKMLDTIALILDSAKMDAGLFTLRKTQSDLKKLIQSRIALFTPVAFEKSIELKVNVDPNIPIFSFDPIRIDEVINNLLSNSLKFTPQHGTISLSAHVTLDKILVSVSDTGQGIPKDKQAKLFAKYQQAPSEGEHVGTGLGLYVVKQVVEDHGGAVTLDSDAGKGTTITFTLPLHPLTKPQSTTGTPSSTQPPKLVN